MDFFQKCFIAYPSALWDKKDVIQWGRIKNLRLPLFFMKYMFKYLVPLKNFGR